MALSKNEIRAVLRVIDEWEHGYSITDLYTPPIDPALLATLTAARAELMRWLAQFGEGEDEQI